MNRLSWALYDANYTFLECEFPHLERVQLHTDDWSRENYFFELLRKNPHLKQFSVQPYTKSNNTFNLKLVSQLLPHLEFLKLFAIEIGNETVHFENFKKFRSFGFNAIDKLSFARLESLQLDLGFFSKFDLWTKFIQKHNNLSNLHVHIHRETEYNQLLELTAMLSNLTKLTVDQYESNINDDIIGHLIGNNQSIREIEIVVSDSVESDLIVLRNRFRNEWNIRCIEDDRKQIVVLKKR